MAHVLRTRTRSPLPDPAFVLAPSRRRRVLTLVSSSGALTELRISDALRQDETKGKTNLHVISVLPSIGRPQAILRVLQKKHARWLLAIRPTNRVSGCGWGGVGGGYMAGASALPATLAVLPGDNEFARDQPVMYGEESVRTSAESEDNAMK